MGVVCSPADSDGQNASLKGVAPQADSDGPRASCRFAKIGASSTSEAVLGFAIAGTITFAFCGWVMGVLVGGLAGVAVGFPLGLFTFGLSIPIAAVVGGGVGGAIGVLVGGTIGFVTGGAFGFTVFKWRAEIFKVLAFVWRITTSCFEAIWVFAVSTVGSAACVFRSKAADVWRGAKRNGSRLCAYLQIDPQDKQTQFAAVSGTFTGIIFAACCGAVGLGVGALVGAILGIIPAIFTFGISIPIGALIGGGLGLFLGAGFGGISGFTVGCVVGYAIYRKFIAPSTTEETTTNDSKNDSPDVVRSDVHGELDANTSDVYAVPESMSISTHRGVEKTWKCDDEVVATYLQNLIRLQTQVEKSLFQIAKPTMEPSVIFSDRGMMDVSNLHSPRKMDVNNLYSPRKWKDDIAIATLNEDYDTDDPDPDAELDDDDYELEKDFGGRFAVQEDMGASKRKLPVYPLVGVPFGFPVSAGWDAWKVSPRLCCSDQQDDQEMIPSLATLPQVFSIGTPQATPRLS